MRGQRWKLGWWLFAAISLAAVLVIAERRLINGDDIPGWDAERFFAPYYLLVADHAKEGCFLLWDPWTQAGLPACAYPEIGSFSPLLCLSAWATGPTLWGFVGYWFLFWFFGGLGMTVLARHLGAPGWAAWALGVGFLFNGFFVGHAEHTSWIFSFSAIPWILWRLDVSVMERRIRPAAEAGALWGLSMLAGYPGVVLVSGLTAGLWVLGRAVTAATRQPAEAFELPMAGPDREAEMPARSVPQRRRRWVLAACGLTVFGVVGLVVMSPTLWMFFQESRGYTDRSGALSREEATYNNGLEPRCLVSLAAPDVPVWGLFNGGQGGWSYTDPSCSSVYLGFCAIWLATLALIGRPDQRWRWWLAGMALLGLILAMGRVFPVCGWLYDACPPARYFRHPPIYLSMSIAAAFALAALGASDLARAWRGDPTHRFFCLGAALAGPALAAVALWAFQWGRSVTAVLGPDSGLGVWHARGGWIALALLGIASAFACRRPWASAALASLFVMLAVIDAFQTAWISRPMTGYWEPSLLADWPVRLARRPAGLDAAAPDGWVRRPKADAYPYPNCKHLLEKVPVFHASVAMTRGYHESWAQTAQLLETAVGPERIWFSREAMHVQPDSAAFHALHVRVKSGGGLPMLIHTPEQMIACPEAPGKLEPPKVGQILRLPRAEPIDAEIREYRPNSLVFQVECPANGWLLATDRWAPGWRVTVNGRPQAVLGGNFIFRAIEVQQGGNEVRFEYRPWGHPWLAAGSYATLACVGVGSVLAVWLPRRRLSL